MTGVFPARDDHDIAKPAGDHGLQGVINHRFIVNRQKMFIGDAGHRPHPATGSPRENNAFHIRLEISD